MGCTRRARRVKCPKLIQQASARSHVTRRTKVPYVEKRARVPRRKLKELDSSIPKRSWYLATRTTIIGKALRVLCRGSTTIGARRGRGPLLFLGEFFALAAGS